MILSDAQGVVRATKTSGRLGQEHRSPSKRWHDILEPSLFRNANSWVKGADAPTPIPPGGAGASALGLQNAVQPLCVMNAVPIVEIRAAPPVNGNESNGGSPDFQNDTLRSIIWKRCVSVADVCVMFQIAGITGPLAGRKVSSVVFGEIASVMLTVKDSSRDISSLPKPAAKASKAEANQRSRYFQKTRIVYFISLSGGQHAAGSLIPCHYFYGSWVSYGARRWSPYPYPDWVAGLNGWIRAEGRWTEGKTGDVLIDKAAASVEIMTMIKVLEDTMVLEEMRRS
ncbi:hypothetical protein BKA70DRAFT_1236268 [Coprinopsis sp. MPI-PUGE-AT-0042]|nr:hypothetical protein BKA70DRAFT_1236268 [Coprinopsis sp. MPI-PUGE-AT-0042]